MKSHWKWTGHCETMREDSLPTKVGREYKGKRKTKWLDKKDIMDRDDWKEYIPATHNRGTHE